MMAYEKRLQEFKELIKRIEYFKYTLNTVLYWDKLKSLPQGATEYHNKAMGAVSHQMQMLISDGQFASYLKYFEQNSENDFITNHMVARIQQNQFFITQIPPTVHQAYVALLAQSEDIWYQARQANSYDLFAPYLEKLVALFQTFSQCWGYEDHPYDAHLHYNLQGLTTGDLDALVATIQPFLIESLQTIQASGRTLPPGFQIEATQETQQQLWIQLLGDMGFDFTRGRIDVGQYTTILNYSVDDVRILIDFEQDNVFTGLFDALHSGGKGIYQQNISRHLLGTFLCETPSFACEEAIGRFYENLMRHKGFWQYACKKYPHVFDGYTPEQLYVQANRVEPSCIRIKRDEITDLLHICIRYEMEKGLLEGTITVDTLKEKWNQAYETYLGVTPKDDNTGVLQDIHWAVGYFGYFPTYILSNVICAQLYHSIQADLGDMDTLLSQGEFEKINLWFKDKVFQYGAALPTECLIEQATNQPLTCEYYLEYLKEKYSFMYDIHL